MTKLLPSCPRLPSSFLAAVAVLLAPACTSIDPDVDADTDGNDTDGNDTDGVDESGEPAGDCTAIVQDDLAADLTLPAGCYEVATALTVDGSTLSLEPGVDIEFASGAGLMINGTGVFSASGTAEQPVLLHGADPQPGSWMGLRYSGSASSDNRLAFVELRDAGASAFGDPAGVVVSAGSRLSVEGSTIADNEGIGIIADAGAELSLTSTSVAGNDAPLSVDIETVGGIAGDNTLTGNGQDVAHVTGTTLATDASWANLGVPLVMADEVRIDAHLQIAEGAELRMGQERSIRVAESGALTATGTADSPVVFTGQVGEPGYWQGIELASNTADNVLEGCIVENAGSTPWTGDNDSSTALRVPENGKLTLRDSTVRGSGHYGLRAYGDADIAGLAGNRFESNARVMLVHPNLVGGIEADNDFADNDEPFVRVTFGNNDRVETAQTWLDIGVPLHINVRTQVEAPLTLAAGLVVQFDQDAALRVLPGGTLTAAGTEDSPVLMTGAETLPGYWQGLQFGTISADNRLEHTRIEYAGGEAWLGGNDREAAIFLGGSQLDALVELVDSTIADSAGNGILIQDDDSSVACSGVAFEGIAKANVSGPGQCG